MASGLNTLTKTSMNDQGTIINTTIFPPIGVSHDLQEAITSLMHRLVMEDGTTTLAELGYLHMNSICFVNGGIEAKVYFAPELALESTTGFANYTKMVPNKKLNMFQNYLFVGNLEQAISYDTITTPKYTIEKDDADRPAIYLRNKKTTEDKEVLVLHCNADMLLAAILDINMADPNFKIQYETIGKGDKNNAAGQIMITAGTKQEFPVRITVTSTMKTPDSDVAGYDPEMAVYNLLGRYQAQKEAIATRKKLAQKASDRAEKISKKSSAQKAFTAYKKYR